MIVWALEVKDGKPRNVVHIAAVSAKRSRGGIYETAKFCETACGRELAYGEWADAEATPSNGTLPVVCRECAGLTVAEIWDEAVHRG